jgi:hypothetical protein
MAELSNPDGNSANLAEPEAVAEFLIGKSGTVQIYGYEILLPELPEPGGSQDSRVPMWFVKRLRHASVEEEKALDRLLALIANDRCEQVQRCKEIAGG